MSNWTFPPPTDEERFKLKEYLIVLRSSESSLNKIHSAFAALLSMPSLFEDPRWLKEAGSSREELQSLSKRHRPLFESALKHHMKKTGAYTQH